MRTLHKNFTDASEVEVDGRMHSANTLLVTIICRSGNLYFQHDMRPEQARGIAKALLDAADELEPVNDMQIKLLEAA